MRVKSTLAAVVLGSILAIGGAAFADTSTNTTTTEKPNGQKVTNSTTNDPSGGKSVSSSSTSDPATGHASSSTTTQHSDGTKTTQTSEKNDNK